MSHLPQSRAHYGGGGNVLCSHLVCLMADEWAEMGNESHAKIKKLRVAVDGAAKQLNESGEVKASVSGEHPASSELNRRRSRKVKASSQGEHRYPTRTSALKCLV